jgi:hypothetical protein
MWIAGLAVIAAIAATYHLTRPPELVWWTSPPIGASGRHAKIVIPRGMDARLVNGQVRDGVWWNTYSFELVDSRPAFLRWLVQYRSEDREGFEFFVHVYQFKKKVPGSGDSGKLELVTVNRAPCAERWVRPPGSGISAMVRYQRANQREFERTYAAICNSLRIE